MTDEATQQYIKMAALPEIRTILQALKSWERFKAYYTPDFDEQAAKDDPELAALVERIWLAVHSSAKHNQKGLSLQEIVLNPAIAIRASTHYKLAEFLPTSTSYEDFMKKAAEKLTIFHSTHPGRLMKLSGLDWNIPFPVTGQRVHAERHHHAQGDSARHAPADATEQTMAIAATDGVKSILRALQDGRQYMEKYYPDGQPFLADEAAKDQGFLTLLHRLFGSINRSLGRDPSAKDIQSHGPARTNALQRNIARSVHFRLSQILLNARTEPDFKKYVKLTIPNYKGSETKLYQLGGFNWDIRFPHEEPGQPPLQGEPESLFDVAKKTETDKATTQPEQVEDLLVMVEKLTEDLEGANQERAKMNEQLEDMQKVLRLVIDKGTNWKQPLTNEEIRLIHRYLS